MKQAQNGQGTCPESTDSGKLAQVKPLESSAESKNLIWKLPIPVGIKGNYVTSFDENASHNELPIFYTLKTGSDLLASFT
jgi:hypothetical protein